MSVLEQTRTFDTMTMTELVGILKAHEARINAREENTHEGAFNIQPSKRHTNFKQGDFKTNNQDKITKKTCNYCKKNNHVEEKCFKKMKDMGPSKKQGTGKTCYNCGQSGHFARQCRNKKNERALVSLEKNESEDEEDHMLFTASEEALTILKDDVWLIDSGCTNHMTKEEKYFSRIDRSFKVPIRVGNGELVMTAGRGDIYVVTEQGKRLIKNVFLVPGLEKNLLSVPQIISSGYRVIFEDKLCIIQNQRGKEVMRIPMTHKSFRVKWNKVENQAMVSQVQEEANKWHKRLGHVGHKRLLQIQEKKLLDGLPKFEVRKETCEACNLGKQSRKGFPKESSTRTKEKLELVHTDVCGPMQNQSLEGNRFFVLFLDDFTHMSWVYFVKHKSESLSMFKKFKALVEKEAQCQVKTLRSDGGGEFTSLEFKQICMKKKE